LLNLEKKRNTLKKLRDKGKSNFLLFIPCLIAYFFVSVYYFFALHLDMLLSDKDGRFLGIEKHGKANKYAASASKKRAHGGDDYTPGGSRVKTGARLVSAFLMVCFAFTFLPTLGVDFGLSLGVSAATDIAAIIDIDDDGDVDLDDKFTETNYSRFLSIIDAAQVSAPAANYTLMSNLIDFEDVEMDIDATGAGDGKLIISFHKETGRTVPISKYDAEIRSTDIKIYDSLGTTVLRTITVNYDALGNANTPIIVLGDNELRQSNITYRLTNYYDLPSYRITKRDLGTDSSYVSGSGTDTAIIHTTVGAVEWDIERSFEDYTYSRTPSNASSNVNREDFTKTQQGISNISATIDYTDTAAPNGKVVVSWGAAPDAEGYILYRKNRDTGLQDGTPITINTPGQLQYPAEGSGIIYTATDATTVYDYEVVPYQGITTEAATGRNPQVDIQYFMYGPRTGPFASVVSLVQTPEPSVNFTTATPIAPRGYQVGWNTVPKIANAAEVAANPDSSPPRAGYVVYRLPLTAIIANSGGTLTDASDHTAILAALNSPRFLDNSMELMKNTSDNRFTIGNTTNMYSDVDAVDGQQYYYAITAYRTPDARTYESKPLYIPTTLTARPGVPADFEVQPNSERVILKWDAVQTNSDPLAPTYADSYVINVTVLDAAGNPTNVTGTREVTVATPSDLRATFTNGKMTTPISIEYFLSGGVTPVNFVNGTRYAVTVRAVDNRVQGSQSSQVRVLVGGTPSQPAGLSVTPSENTITLDWNAVSGADYYTIIHGERDPSTGTVTTWSAPERVNTNRFVHGNLINGDLYGYRVTAWKTVGTGAIALDNLVVDELDSVETAPIYGQVGSNLPAPVSPVFTQTGNVVRLSWAAGPNPNNVALAGYYVNITGDNGTTQSIPITATNYTHTINTEGVYYSYSVQSYAIITGIATRSTALDFSDKGYVAPPATNKPATPLDFTAAAQGTTGVRLTWTDANTPSGYIVYGKNGVVTSAATIMSSPDYNSGFISAANKSHVDTSLAAGQTRSYVVVAYRQTGDTYIESNPTVVRTYPPSGGEVTPPGTGTGSGLAAPLDFLVATTDGTATLTWKAVENAYGYRVHASGPSGNVVFDRSTPGFTHTPLLNGEKWTYYVTALTQSGSGFIEGTPSPSYTVTIGVTLNQPQDFRFTAGNRQIDLEWTAVAGAEGYIVYQYNQSLMQFEPISVITEPKYSAMGLTNDREYTFMVAAYKTINGTQHLSQYSMSVTAKPTTGSPTDLDRKITVKGTAPYGMDRSDLMGAYANHGAFDGDVDIYIQSIDSSEQAIKNALSGFANGLSSFIIYPFDITLYQAGTFIEPVLNPGYTVTITLPLPDELVRYRDYIQVMHLNDSGTLENLRSSLAEIEGTWCIQFPVLDFSPFAFVIYKDQIIDAASGVGTFGAFASNAFGQIVNFPQAMLPFGIKIQRGKRRVFRILKIGRKV
jgi:hypothetical protein